MTYCLAEPQRCTECRYSYTEPEVNYWKCEHLDYDGNCPGEESRFDRKLMQGNKEEL